MKLLPSNSIPAWQIERLEKIQRACRHIKTAVQRGEQISAAIRRVSRYFHRRNFKSDPSRRLQLAPGTLRASWDKWNRCAQSADAFQLKYYTQPPYVPRPLLIRFVKFCSDNHLPSVRSAWKTFSALKRNAQQARTITYSMVSHYFDDADFCLMQGLRASSDSALAALAGIRLTVATDIMSRLPARPAARRVKRRNSV
jgi:hypothetical protein